MSRKQTPDGVTNNYGLGCAAGNDWFGHGGAHATNMEVRPGKGLVLIWMVQHAGFPGDGEKSQDAFRQWALERFAKGN
jgi:CubicO group peptidase (beta-lactamase class C family)